METPLDIYHSMLELDTRKLRDELRLLEQHAQMKRSELNNKLKVLVHVKEILNAN